MHVIFSFLYAPLIVLLLGYFQIQHVAIGVLIFGLIWLLSIKQKTLQNIIFPSFYCAVALIAFFLNDFIVFKFLPLLISLSFIFFLIVSYFENDSIILKFARKLHKIDEKEEVYIQKSTRFWIFIAFLNILLHISVLMLHDDSYWVIYSSFGWYMVFAFGGVLQFMHRKYIFLKRDALNA